MNLASRFFNMLAPGDDRPAIREANGSMVSRGELRRFIVGLQHYLIGLGFKKGDTVVIQAPTGAAFAAATIAVSTLGGVSLLAEPGLGDEIYSKRLQVAKPRWSLVHPVVLWANRIPGARKLLARREIMVPPLLPAGTNLTQLTLSTKMLRRFAADVSAEPIVETMAPRDDVTIIFTGGSTSLPKGVRLSHGSVSHTLDNVESVAADNGADTLIADNPQQVLFGLVMGKEVLVTRGRIQRRAEMVRQLIERGEAHAYFGSPFVWMEMMEQAGPSRPRLPASLKSVFLGGAPVTREFLTALRGWLAPETKVTIIYGLTEVGPVAWASDHEKIAWDGEGDLLGRVMPGTTAKIGENDEIQLISPSLFNGYIGQEELPAGGTFATGDLGRMVERNGEQLLVLIGRAKDMIIRAAVNIYPATLEADLRAITDNSGKRLLREVAMIGLWDEVKQDEAVVLCWQPMAETRVDEASLSRLVHAVTGDAAKPDFMMMCDPLPVRGRLNKVDKAALRAQAAAKFGLSAVPRGQRD
jgi:acyl-CoA synthetase (AMP-forming)/AMP-acid ligase II